MSIWKQFLGFGLKMGAVYLAYSKLTPDQQKRCDEIIDGMSMEEITPESVLSVIARVLEKSAL